VTDQGGYPYPKILIRLPVTPAGPTNAQTPDTWVFIPFIHLWAHAVFNLLLGYWETKRYFN